MKLEEGLLNLLFPPKCPFCRTVLDEPGICGKCRETLPWTQEEETLRTGPGHLECAAPLFYEDAVRECLLRLKFRGGVPAAEPLGQLVAQCAAEQLSGQFDTVTWVPVGPKRLRSRGYDQARLLAEAACRCWGVKPAGQAHGQSGPVRPERCRRPPRQCAGRLPSGAQSGYRGAADFTHRRHLYHRRHTGGLHRNAFGCRSRRGGVRCRSPDPFPRRGARLCKNTGPGVLFAGWCGKFRKFVKMRAVCLQSANTVGII